MPNGGTRPVGGTQRHQPPLLTPHLPYASSPAAGSQPPHSIAHPLSPFRTNSSQLQQGLEISQPPDRQLGVRSWVQSLSSLSRPSARMLEKKYETGGSEELLRYDMRSLVGLCRVGLSFLWGTRSIFFFFERIYPPVEMDCVLCLFFFLTYQLLWRVGSVEHGKDITITQQIRSKSWETWQLIYVREKTT